MSDRQNQSEFLEPGHDHGPCLARTLERAEAAFEDRGLRMTPLRREVLQEIAGSHTAVGAYEILDRLARKGGRRLAPISVYRALDSLVEAGVVHRLESRNAFFACHMPHAADRRQVVLSCERCSTVAEIDAGEVFDGVSAISDQADFTISRILVEVSGTCTRCMRTAA